MAEEKESSVLFSLNELMSLEEDRIQQEDASKAAAEQAEREAREAAERAARDAEELRLNEEEERRRSEELRRREEEARLEAIRHSEIEKGRAEAEHRAKMEALGAQQAHEAQLASLTRDKGKKRLQIAVGVVAGVLIIGGVATGVAWKRNADQQAAAQAALMEQQRQAQEELKKLQGQFATAREKESSLQASLRAAKDDAERARLQAELEAAKKATQKARGAVGRAAPASGGGGPKKPASTCNCPPGDPLCSCL